MKTNRLRHLLIVVYFIASFMSAIHIHKDAQVHDDCKICIVHKNLHSNTPPTPITYTDCIECSYEAILFKPTLVQITLDKGFNAKAPPHIC